MAFFILPLLSAWDLDIDSEGFSPRGDISRGLMTRAVLVQSRCLVVTRSLVLCVCFVDRCLSFCFFFFCALCCLFFFDLRILIYIWSMSSLTSVSHVYQKIEYISVVMTGLNVYKLVMSETKQQKWYMFIHKPLDTICENQRGYQKLFIKGQTIHCPKEKWQATIYKRIHRNE
jgi:hypothetical protein